METLGTEYGGWDIPINAKLNEDSIVYSGGVGEDISFDLKLQDGRSTEFNIVISK